VPPSQQGIASRTVTGLSRHNKVVAAPQAARQRKRIPGRWPLRDGDDVIHIGIAFEDALAAAEREHIQPRRRNALPHGADERSGEQHVAEAAQRDH
jgi:hypothetical protein